MAAEEPRRVLSLFDATQIVIGSIVGGGIFVVSGEVAARVRSPGAFFAVWIAGGLVAGAGALCYGELGARFPRSGGEYVYLREAYGPLAGFLSGWTSFFIGFPGSIATLARGFGDSTAPLLGDETGRTSLPLALTAVLGLTAVNALGLGPGKWAQNVLSGVKLVAFVAIVVLAVKAPREGPSHLVPLFGRAASATDLALALVPVFFAYSGWNAATYVAGEIRGAERTLGRALVIGTAVCMALYLAIHVAYLRALSLDEMAGRSDVARAAVARLGGTAQRIFGPLVPISIASSLQAAVLTGPRITAAMARDGLFFAPLARVSPRLGTPAAALWAQAAIASTLLLTGTFEHLLTFTTFALLLFSTLTAGALVVVRLRGRAAAPGGFRAPAFPLAPALFIAANGWVMVTVVASGVREALAGLAIVGLGVPAYAWLRARRRG